MARMAEELRRLRTATAAVSTWTVGGPGCVSTTRLPGSRFGKPDFVGE